ncbi:MAG: hypothetical protein JWL85_459 [Candidatus Saccharibacteria bacterium]|nr:hypothetical protein [Candidatus Saccharibacteria bacterium]
MVLRTTLAEVFVVFTNTCRICYMSRVKHYTKLIVLDTIGVLLMITALLTGWLPGPGGIPLFILGLSFLAINHEWAERHMNMLKKYADRLGDLIFIDKPAVQRAYDILAPPIVALGIFFLVRHSAIWMMSLGVSFVFTGLALLLGNRHRLRRLKAHLRKQR